MNAKGLISGFIAGAAVGAAAGLLLAPASGEKTRRKIAKGSMRMKNNIVDYVENAVGSLRNQVNSKIDRLTRPSKDGVVRGKEAYDHITERVK